MQQTLKQISVIYLALLGAQTIAFLVVYSFWSRNILTSENDLFPFYFAVPGLTLAGIVTAQLINRQRMIQAGKLNFSLKQKIEHYKTTVLVRSAILEGVNVFAVIAAFVSGNIGFLIYFIIGFLLFLYYWPTQGKFEDAYQITGSESAQLR